VTDELNEIGIRRIIESAERVAKDEDKAGRQTIYRAAEAVISECRLEESEREKAIAQLKEALRI
jgi:hypothetical protein